MGADHVGPSDPTPPPLRRINLPDLRKRFGRVLTVVAAVSAALIWLGGLVSGVDVLGQGVFHIGRIIRPEPSLTPAPTPTAAPPVVLVGDLSDLRFTDRDLRLGAVYEAENQPIPREYDNDRDRLDAMLSYRAMFRGFSGRATRVTWTLYDATIGERVPDGYWKTINPAGLPDGRWKVEAVTADTVIGEIWIPYPDPGQFHVELTLYDDRGVMLDRELGGQWPRVGELQALSQ